MRIDVLAAGVGAEPVVGKVHSVFTHACNIELGSGRLLGLVAREIGAVPRGYQLATPDGFSFLDHVRVGAAVSSRAGLVRIEQSSLSVDLRPGVPWRSDLGRHPIRCERREVAAAWRVAWNALVADGGAVPLQRRAGGAIKVLIDAILSGRVAQIGAAVDSLIGSGEGLTPAGDDFLVGFVAGLAALPADGERAAFRAALAAAIVAAATGTGAISRLYLEAAIAGEVSEPLAALASAIGRGDVRDTAAAAARALAVGASSGAAASYGLLLAVRATKPVTQPADERPPASSPKRDAIRPPGR